MTHMCLYVQAADGPGALADDASETAHQQGEDATACTTDRNGAGDETDVLPTERTQLSGQAWLHLVQPSLSQTFNCSALLHTPELSDPEPRPNSPV